MANLLDQQALELAAIQHWVLTREQALALGYRESAIDYRLRTEQWKPIRESCYLVVPVDPRPRVFLEAAVHSIRGAFVSHESAGELHGLHHVPRGLMVISVPTKTTHAFPNVIVRRPNDVEHQHLEVLDGLPVTTAIRTAFDLTTLFRYGRVERILDDAIVAGHFDLETYREFAESLCRRGKPGSANNRRYLAERGTGYVAPTTELERILLSLLRRGGLPNPELQVPLPWYQPAFGICDGYYREARLIIEADGRRWHTLLADFESDRKRDNEAMRNGHRVLRFTYDTLTKSPGQVISLVRDTLALTHS